jgi:hypothetical protein
MFDNLYVGIDKPGGLPLNLKLGRQDIFLGNGWLIADGTPIDGSRTDLSRRPARHLDRSPTTNLEAILVKQNAHTTLTLDGKDEDQTEQDEQGLILYLRHKWNPTTDVDAYYFYKDNAPVDGHARTATRSTTASSSPGGRSVRRRPRARPGRAASRPP